METFCLIKLVCPFCYEDSFAQIQKVRNHCQRRHDILLPSRHRADQPPKNSKKYDKDLHEAYPSIPVKLGCPCCSALLSDKLTLITHVVKEHNIPYVDSDRNSPESFSFVEDMPWRTATIHQTLK